MTFLILKNENSVIVLSSLFILIIIILSLGVLMSFFIMKDFGENKDDYFVVFILYLIAFAFLFIAKRFKYKGNLNELEIENIGKHED
ncbi:hypothetical protein ACM39_16890 [Chryseobacterium sp. FH2]|nr:hypothetical protein ACM39_16890 [Chryseobacterium sp. FH2]